MLSQTTHSDVVALRKPIEDISIRTERLQSHADQELQSRLSRWLGIPDPSTNFHAALEKRHPQTGLWLVKDQQFSSWRSSASSLMWLHGNAGCGKTVLSAASLEEILRSKEVQPDTVVSYFYFDFNDVEKQSSPKAIRSLLFQFSLQQQNRLQILEDLYRRCQNGQQQPAEDVIRSLLKDAVACTGYKYIILDALDECVEREDFMLFIRDLVPSHQKGLRIMITSRRERDIEEHLGSIANFAIGIQSAIVDEDIGVYVRNRLATDSKLKKWPAKVQEDIVAILMEKSDGMFRWVYCQLESIRQCVKLSALKKALSTLPKTLDETYERILQGLESAGQLQDAITVLRWLCFSRYPLNLSEIIEVLAIENGASGGFCPDERLPDPADIMAICSSLISCSHIDEETSDSHTNEGTHNTQIRLAHFSVKEYLLSDRCLLTLNFQKATCHMTMAESCLHYLLYLYENLPLTEDLVFQHPLSRYAAENWWEHAQAADHTLNPTVINLARELLLNKDASVLPLVQLFDVDDPWAGVVLSRPLDAVAPPLYYAASIGLLQVVEDIIPHIDDINTQGGECGNALQAACYHGHEDVVQILLNAGADVNAKGGQYGNALQAACYHGHKDVVQILLNAGANVNAKGGQYGNALRAACYHGHKDVVQILLNAGADVNAEGGQYGTALVAASDGGYEKVVKILLDAGANIDTDGGGYGTALGIACLRSHEKVVQILLDAGADINAEGKNFNPLQTASFHGSEKIIKILLDAGADVNIRGKNGTALWGASMKGHERAVQILLDAGADINARDIHGNALHIASRLDFSFMIRTLLDAGADINAEDGFYDTVLQATSQEDPKKIRHTIFHSLTDIIAETISSTALLTASFFGHEKVVNTLLAAGADANIKGKRSTALQNASTCDHEKIVQILLDAGADINAEEGYFGTALMAASLYNHDKIVKVLLNARADINAEGIHGTALQIASRHDREKVVQILLNAGADVSIKGQRRIARQGHEKVTKILSKVGMNFIAEEFQNIALHKVSEHDYMKTVKRLLDVGIDINAEEYQGTALQEASNYGHMKIIDILLDVKIKFDTEK
ncbi:MAG: hypothetical protein Q9195_009047 [Heterodermia aff. obscurata]